MFRLLHRGQEGKVLPSKEGVFMRIALSLRKLGLTSDVLHGLGRSFPCAQHGRRGHGHRRDAAFHERTLYHLPAVARPEGP